MKHTLVRMPAQAAAGVPQTMDEAPLPDGFRKNLPDRLLQTGMVVQNDLDAATEAAIPQRLQEPPPARVALPLREIDARNLPAARPVAPSTSRGT